MKLQLLPVTLLIFATTLASGTADADTGTATAYKQVFLVNGREASAEQAIVASMKGAEVLKCQSAEFKVSKSGTSIGIRNVKKPRKN